MAVLRGAAGWIIRQAAAMQAAAGGRRWRACPPRWRRWRLRCCCEVWQGWQAVGAVQVVQGWRWCVVIVGGGLLLAWSSGAALAVLILPGAGGGAISMRRVQRSPGIFQLFPGAAQHPARRAADPAGRAGGRRAGGRRRKRKRPGRRRVVRCCSGLLSALAVRSAAPGASRCISWAAGSAPRSGAGLLALALIRAQRFQLATFQHGTACAGGAPSGAFLSRRRRGQILHFTG
nr:MAG TPA: hypothetical protein [Caudoviricetes sp.]